MTRHFSSLLMSAVVTVSLVSGGAVLVLRVGDDHVREYRALNCLRRRWNLVGAKRRTRIKPAAQRAPQDVYTRYSLTHQTPRFLNRIPLFKRPAD